MTKESTIKGLSFAKKCLRPESAPLTLDKVMFYPLVENLVRCPCMVNHGVSASDFE